MIDCNVQSYISTTAEIHAAVIGPRTALQRGLTVSLAATLSQPGLSIGDMSFSSIAMYNRAFKTTANSVNAISYAARRPVIATGVISAPEVVDEYAPHYQKLSELQAGRYMSIYR